MYAAYAVREIVYLISLRILKNIHFQNLRFAKNICHLPITTISVNLSTSQVKEGSYTVKISSGNPFKMHAYSSYNLFCRDDKPKIQTENKKMCNIMHKTLYIQSKLFKI